MQVTHASDESPRSSRERHTRGGGHEAGADPAPAADSRPPAGRPSYAVRPPPPLLSPAALPSPPRTSSQFFCDVLGDTPVPVGMKDRLTGTGGRRSARS